MVNLCFVCQCDDSKMPFIRLREKGVKSLQTSADQRGDSLTITNVTNVHEECRKKYIHPTYIKALIKRKQESSPSVEGSEAKRHTRAAGVTFDSFSDCLCCCQEISGADKKKNPDDVHYVQTLCVSNSLHAICKQRNDQWACEVSGRLAFLDDQLIAADCIYHQSCSINFRTYKPKPKPKGQFGFKKATSSSEKHPAGRPKNSNQQSSFEELCTYINKNIDEVMTVQSLCDKMQEIMNHEFPGDSYSPKHMKRELIDYFGDDIHIASKPGFGDIVIYQTKLQDIIRDHFLQNFNKDTEDKKRSIIEAAGKIIRSEMKDIESTPCFYPENDSLTEENALSWLPESLRTMLAELLPSTRTTQVASIGQAIVQNCRPRSVLSPLQIALGVQLHHTYRSRYLIDHLNALGFCCSYSEVQRFELNSAAMTNTDLLGDTKDSKVVLFAGDNVDSNIRTIDGKNTFHAMGIIASVIPKNDAFVKLPRRQVSNIDVISSSKITIKDYYAVLRVRSTIKFDKLRELTAPQTSNIDLLWELSLFADTPNWSGVMSILHRNSAQEKSSVYFLPMIRMSPTDVTCIYSTLNYVCNLAREAEVHPIATFDQPIFWKASEIVETLPETDQCKNVLLMLGCFHTEMNLLGAIGTLMQGTGITDFFSTVYAENSLQTIMSGKSVQRSFRAHLLLDKCVALLISEKVENNSEFENLLTETQAIFSKLKTDGMNTDASQSRTDKKLDRLEEIVQNKKTELGNSSRTKKLWIQYLDMVKVVRDLVRADRSKDWKLHLNALRRSLPIMAAAGHSNYTKSVYLYLMKMGELKKKHPEVHQLFLKGMFVSQRTDGGWLGLANDLVIEQCLMRSLKITGGLARGAGWTERLTTLFTLSAHICASVNESMQEMTRKAYTTSDQHKEERVSRVARDFSDLQKMLEKVKVHSSMKEDDGELRNVVTGVHALPSVNVDDFQKIGENALTQMIGKNVFQYTYSRKLMVVTLANADKVKIDDEKSIDPMLLFQRLIIVAQNGALNLQELIKYEVCVYPPALFERRNMTLKANKADLAHAITEKCGSGMDHQPDTEIIDGGCLLFCVAWQHDTYGDLAHDYASFVRRRYNNPVVIFDGYDKATTKDMEHPVSKPEIDITKDTKIAGKREDILGNSQNKTILIGLIREFLSSENIENHLCSGDADTSMADYAVKAASTGSKTTVVGEDTDVLILLISKLKTGHVVFKSPARKRCEPTHCNIRHIYKNS